MITTKNITETMKRITLLLLCLLVLAACDDGDEPDEPMVDESAEVADPVGEEVTTVVDLYVAESADSCGEDLRPIRQPVTFTEGEIIGATVNALFDFESPVDRYNAVASDDLMVEEVNTDAVGTASQNIWVRINGTPDFPEDECGRDLYAAQLNRTLSELTDIGTFVYFAFDGETPDWLLQRTGEMSGELGDDRDIENVENAEQITESEMGDGDSGTDDANEDN